MSLKGLDQLSKKLNQLAKNAKALDGTHSVALNDLLTPSFISQNTRFSNTEELFEASGFKFQSQEEFKEIPEDKLDEFIRSESPFESWKAMLTAASAAWTKRKLGL